MHDIEFVITYDILLGMTRVIWFGKMKFLKVQVLIRVFSFWITLSRLLWQMNVMKVCYGS